MRKERDIELGVHTAVTAGLGQASASLRLGFLIRIILPAHCTGLT